MLLRAESKCMSLCITPGFRSACAKLILSLTSLRLHFQDVCPLLHQSPYLTLTMINTRRRLSFEVPTVHAYVQMASGAHISGASMAFAAVLASQNDFT